MLNSVIEISNIQMRLWSDYPPTLMILFVNWTAKLSFDCNSFEKLLYTW